MFRACEVLEISTRTYARWKNGRTRDSRFLRLSWSCNLNGLHLHSDNGTVKKAATMLMTFYRLEVMPSFSRPRVSDDNPYSESLFKTMKYHVEYPQNFADIGTAHSWLAGFVDWYNTQHRHSGIGYVPP